MDQVCAAVLQVSSRVAASYPATWDIAAVVFIVCYLRMNWIKRRIQENSIKE